MSAITIEKSILWCGGWTDVGFASDLFSFDTVSNTLTEIHPNLEARKATAQPVYAQSGNTIFFFSGINEENQLDSIFRQYSIERRLWSTIQPSGDSPAPRIGASFVSVGDFIFLFGGRSKEQYMVGALFSSYSL